MSSKLTVRSKPTEDVRGVIVASELQHASCDAAANAGVKGDKTREGVRYLSLQATATTRSPGSSPYGSSVRGSRPAEVSSGRPRHPPVLSPHAKAPIDFEPFSDDTPHESC